VDDVRRTLVNLGFQELSPRKCLRPVPNIQTEFVPRGQVTLFDCLFSDVRWHMVEHYSCWRAPLPYDPLLGGKVQRYERHDERGNILETWLIIYAGNEQSVRVHLKGDRLVDVEACWWGPRVFRRVSKGQRQLLKSSMFVPHPDIRRGCAEDES
jgi:hypothetical protein